MSSSCNLLVEESFERHHVRTLVSISVLIWFQDQSWTCFTTNGSNRFCSVLRCIEAVAGQFKYSSFSVDNQEGAREKLEGISPGGEQKERAFRQEIRIVS
jgi:hypothetical protein